MISAPPSGALSRVACAIAIVGASTCAGVAPTRAAPPERARAAIQPPSAELGQQVVYRGQVIFHGGAGPTTMRWYPPEDDASFTWGTPVPAYVRGVVPSRTGADARQPSKAAAVFDTAFIEVPLQVFRTGVVSVPGLRFAVVEGTDTTLHRLPVVELPIVPVLSAADSAARLRPLKGPIGAPWWERVPWRWVLGALAVLAAAIWLARRLRRRKPVAPPRPAQAPVLDPISAALAELAALRRLGLPGAGRFGEHALALTRIVKRFLEGTRGTPRPGDTTPELITRLAAEGGDAVSTGALESLLRRWDRVKFAREQVSRADAEATEDEAERVIRSGRPGGEIG